LFFISLNRYWNVLDKNQPWTNNPSNSLPSDTFGREEIIELLKSEPNFTKVQELRQKAEDQDNKDKNLREK